MEMLQNFLKHQVIGRNLSWSRFFLLPWLVVVGYSPPLLWLEIANFEASAMVYEGFLEINHDFSGKTMLFHVGFWEIKQYFD